ncbi:MAG: 1-(5-phosphoribosyl)-5-[(5-phosphoribosylamino)methylideneamino]imidazole-4-carboxamide isomerase [bacterium]|jgi:phosphoribosylformimino-5-aminoimidazole carboxamide ribotide isomerase|nr:1-(5-phosphoribosyl)-5-[(5-phosphoribosylamino)methylideneamino]imidazole-4-carboxamide isomerase [bacterium]
MIIIPAIDMLDGCCVRLMQGDYEQKTVYGEDPAEMARRWEAEGAERIHLVDLNGAREGKPVNLDAVARIASAVNVPLQLGGGLRTADDIKRVLDLGVERVIIGTAALNEGLAAELLGYFREALILGIDARNGQVAIKGWLEQSTISAVNLAERMAALGARRIIYTDISRDGAMSGPNVAATADLAQSCGLPVIASGGVSNLQDIENLVRLESKGIEGAIIGRALYNGTIKLPEAIAAGQVA